MEQVQAILRELDALAATRYVPPHCRTFIYAALNDLNQRSQWQAKGAGGRITLLFTRRRSSTIFWAADPRHLAADARDGLTVFGALRARRVRAGQCASLSGYHNRSPLPHHARRADHLRQLHQQPVGGRDTSLAARPPVIQPKNRRAKIVSSRLDLRDPIGKIVNSIRAGRANKSTVDEKKSSGRFRPC